MQLLTPLLWSNLHIYISTSASTGLTAMLLSCTSLPRSRKGRCKSSEVMNVLHNHFVSLNTSFLTRGMSVRSVLLLEGVRTSSHKTIHMKKTPNSSPHSSSRSPPLLPKWGILCFRTKPLKSWNSHLRIAQTIRLQTQVMNSCLFLIVQGNSNS